MNLLSYLNEIQKAVDYIENNLRSDLTIAEVAHQVNFSAHHFHRIFKTFVGESLGDYIRRRRLTNAAQLLRDNNYRIIDIASEYGFSSQESFTRAFQKMFGVTPGQYRRKNERLLLKEKPRLTSSILKHLEGGSFMKPRIVEKPSFTVVGLKCTSTLKENHIPELWNEFIPRIREIQNQANQNVTIGLCEFCMNPYDDEFTYMACTPVINVKEVPDGMEVKTVSAQKYVVVTHKGSVETLGDAYDYIYAIWLPKSGYELAEADDFEWYDERFLGPDHEESEVDIYVPIQ